MGLLDGDIADAIYRGFKGKLLRGLIRQSAVPISGGLDEHGDPIETADTDTPIEGFTDLYSTTFRALAGIPTGDLKVCFFAKSAPLISPSKDDRVMFMRAGVPSWYQLRGPIETDPATALWTCQAYQIPVPQ